MIIYVLYSISGYLELFINKIHYNFSEYLKEELPEKMNPIIIF